MKPKLFIVTGNAVKFAELSADLGEFFDCEQKIINEPEIQGSADEILKHKLARAHEIFKAPVLVDDTSVHLDELGGFPGPYMKDFWNHLNPQNMGIKFAGSRMQVTCRLGLCPREGDVIFAEGAIAGDVVAPTHNNHNGREFELFMKPDGMDRPMIEYSIEEKNKFSHRGQAMRKLLEILREEN